MERSVTQQLRERPVPPHAGECYGEGRGFRFIPAIARRANKVIR